MPGPWDNSDTNIDERTKPDSNPDLKSESSQTPPNPWGDTRKKPSQTNIPNLDDLMRRHERAQKQRQSQKPDMPAPSKTPNGWSHNNIAIALFCGLLLFWIASGFYKVEPDEEGVVLRFGEVVRTAQPGFGYHWPYPIESVLRPKVTRVNTTEVDFKNGNDKTLIMTQDENIIDVDFTVNWKIKDAKQYLFNVRDPESTVKMAAESVMREEMGQTGIQAALTDGRQTVEQKTLSELQALLDEYQTGVQVLQIQLQKVDPPGPVLEAFRDVQNARAEKERAANDAQGYANDIVPRAKGDAERIKAEAEAYSQQTVSRAQGEAARFADVYAAYKEAPDITTKRMYIETMEQLMRQSKRIILDSDAKGAVPVLPMDLLKPRSAPAAKESAQ